MITVEKIQRIIKVKYGLSTFIDSHTYDMGFTKAETEYHYISKHNTKCDYASVYYISDWRLSQWNKLSRRKQKENLFESLNKVMERLSVKYKCQNGEGKYDKEFSMRIFNDYDYFKDSKYKPNKLTNLKIN